MPMNVSEVRQRVIARGVPWTPQLYEAALKKGAVPDEAAPTVTHAPPPAPAASAAPDTMRMTRFDQAIPDDRNVVIDTTDLGPGGSLGLIHPLMSNLSRGLAGGLTGTLSEYLIGKPRTYSTGTAAGDYAVNTIAPAVGDLVGMARTLGNLPAKAFTAVKNSPYFYRAIAAGLPASQRMGIYGVGRGAVESIREGNGAGAVAVDALGRGAKDATIGLATGFLPKFPKKLGGEYGQSATLGTVFGGSQGVDVGLPEDAYWPQVTVDPQKMLEGAAAGFISFPLAHALGGKPVFESESARAAREAEIAGVRQGQERTAAEMDAAANERMGFWPVEPSSADVARSALEKQQMAEEARGAIPIPGEAPKDLNQIASEAKAQDILEQLRLAENARILGEAGMLPSESGGKPVVGGKVTDPFALMRSLGMAEPTGNITPIGEPVGQSPLPLPEQAQGAPGSPPSRRSGDVTLGVGFGALENLNMAGVRSGISAGFRGAREIAKAAGRSVKMFNDSLADIHGSVDSEGGFASPTPIYLFHGTRSSEDFMRLRGGSPSEHRFKHNAVYLTADPRRAQQVYAGGFAGSKPSEYHDKPTQLFEVAIPSGTRFWDVYKSTPETNRRIGEEIIGKMEADGVRPDVVQEMRRVFSKVIDGLDGKMGRWEPDFPRNKVTNALSELESVASTDPAAYKSFSDALLERGFSGIRDREGLDGDTFIVVDDPILNNTSQRTRFSGTLSGRTKADVTLGSGFGVLQPAWEAVRDIPKYVKLAPSVKNGRVVGGAPSIIPGMDLFAAEPGARSFFAIPDEQSRVVRAPASGEYSGVRKGDKWIRTGEGAMESMDPKTAEMRSTIRDALSAASGNMGRVMKVLRENGFNEQLNRNERRELGHALRGVTSPILLSPRAAAAYNALDQYRNTVIARARAAGIDVGELQDYFRQQIPKLGDLKKGKVREDVIENLMRTNRAKYPDRAAAEAAIDDFVAVRESKGSRHDQRIAEKMFKEGRANSVQEAMGEITRYRRPLAVKEFGGFKMRGENVPFYDPDPVRAFTKYIEDAETRIAEAHAFGPKGEKMQELINGIENPEVRDAANYLWASARGTTTQADPRDAGSMAWFRKLVGLKLGPLTTIKNIPQILNALTAADTKSFLQGMKDSRTAAGEDFALESGSVVGSSMRNLRELNAGFEQYHEMTGFMPSERLGRKGAANVGRRYAMNSTERLLKTRVGSRQHKFARQALESMDINPDQILKQGGITDAQLRKAGYNFSRNTFFGYQAEDLPPWFNESELGKTITQFKAYGVQQGRFVAKNTIDELRRGNPGRFARNLAILATVYPMTGEVVNDLISAVQGKKRIENLGDELWGAANGEPGALFMRYMQDAAATGATALLTDALMSMKYGSTESLAAGPGIGESARVMNMTGKLVMNGQLSESDMRHLFQMVPLIGPLGSYRVFPEEEK